MNLSSTRAWSLAAGSAALLAACQLYPEHRQHFFALITYAFLLASSLLYFFHRDNGQGHHHSTNEQRS